MTRDPAFAFNPFLPDVSGSHQATMRYQCSGSVAGDYDGVLSTEQGFALAFPAGSAGARRVEILRESGEAEVVTDNSAAIAQTLGGAEPAMGCSVPREHGATGGAIAGALLALSIAMGVRRRSARG